MGKSTKKTRDRYRQKELTRQYPEADSFLLNPEGPITSAYAKCAIAYRDLSHEVDRLIVLHRRLKNVWHLRGRRIQERSARNGSLERQLRERDRTIRELRRQLNEALKNV